MALQDLHLLLGLGVTYVDKVLLVRHVVVIHRGDPSANVCRSWMQLSAQTSQILAIWLGVAFQVISVPIRDVPDPMAFMELLKRMLSDEASMHNACLGPEVFSYRLRMSLRAIKPKFRLFSSRSTFSEGLPIEEDKKAISWSFWAMKPLEGIILLLLLLVCGWPPLSKLSCTKATLNKSILATWVESLFLSSPTLQLLLPWLIDTLVANSLSQVTFS
ncbi:hypothetical protein MG293_010889 [Ovis ammon polii]|uniref:Uncharacterized protein n=1 Tax=Ovis ammon polii TaxID=230172 RepID=A0AAD4U755_OVIAM|nr:hypothetical protein MG293_010889 [Ovis ammon polii]